VIPNAVARDPESYDVIGIAMRIHRELGGGFYEQVYKEAMKIEFRQANIAFQYEVELPIFYRGEKLPCVYRADFICYERLLLEVKAIRQLAQPERAQTLHYLKATRFERGLLLNYGGSSLEYERLTNFQSV
jgi:GxxExxY protein